MIETILAAVAVLFMIVLFGSPLIFLGVMVFILFKATRNNRIISANQEKAALQYVMPCPKCRADMETGYANTSNGLAWYMDYFRPPSRLRLWNSLPNTVNLFPRRRANRSWKCASCQLVCIDTGYLVKP